MKKEQQIYAAIGLGAALFIFVYFNFLLSPVNKSIAQKKKKIAELEQTIESSKKLAYEVDYLTEKTRLLQLDVEDLQKRLPRSKDIPDLLRRITKNAQRFGIKVGMLQPQSVVPLSEYSELPFMLDVTGNFHSLGNFFAEIGQEERLLAVSKLTLTGFNSADKSVSVSGTFIMVAYMAKGVI